VMFVAIELGFYGMVGLLHQATPLREFAWYTVLIGNLLAAAAMGFYFWRTHKELAEEFRHSLDWDTEELDVPRYRADDDEEDRPAPVASRPTEKSR
jgi:hypothetical protein